MAASDGKIHASVSATCNGLAGFGEVVRVEVLDMLGYDGPALYLTITPGDDEDDVEVVIAGHDARRMLRAALAALDSEEVGDGE